jgi:hypothetical protein
LQALEVDASPACDVSYSSSLLSGRYEIGRVARAPQAEIYGAAAARKAEFREEPQEQANAHRYVATDD